MKISHSIKPIIKTLIRNFLYLCPVQNTKIVLLNYKGKGYGDNAKYIAEEIIQEGLPWRLVWLAEDGQFVPDGIKKVTYFGLSAFYELSTSKVIISNSKNNIPINYLSRKKRNQYYLQTWHGDFGPKYIEKEIEDTFSPGYIARSKVDSAATNAVLSGNVFFSTVLKDSFWLPESCQILEFGVPRNDLYFQGDEKRDKLKSRFGFSADDKILLYAPTFRDDYDTSCYSLDFERVRTILQRRDNKTWKIVIRLHPNISSKVTRFDFNEFILDGSVYSDQQELCFISDCLITDYSSIFADFMLMKKPVFLYVPDFEKYADRTTGRGLRDLYYHLPFSMGRNQEELELNITRFNRTAYLEELNCYMQKYYCTFDDGHASERVVNHLKKVIE